MANEVLAVVELFWRAAQNWVVPPYSKAPEGPTGPRTLLSSAGCHS